MEEITKPEAALFLLFLSANFEWDPITNSIHGELPGDVEQFILQCISKLSLFEEVALQTQLEAAIQKYNDLKDFSTTTAEIIQHSTKPLMEIQEDRDLVYYLCTEIVALKGDIEMDSKEEKYLSKLEYYLKIDSAFATSIFFLRIINNALNS